MAIAAASAESEWIALINPDAFAAPSWLEDLMAAAMANPRFDVFGSKLIKADQPTLLDGAGDAYHMSGLVWRMGHGAALPTQKEGVHEIFSPCAGAALYRRSALRETGGFDEDYFCYVEDVDLGFRLRLAGYRCLYVPKSIAHHVGSGTTGGQHSAFALYHGHRNLVWTFFKNMPGILFWLLLPLHIALNLISIVLFSVRGHGKIILRAKRDACLGLPEMWHKRQHIQRNRVATIGAIWRQLDKRLRPSKSSRSQE
jgi:GT2 family glycosyltransferase